MIKQNIKIAILAILGLLTFWLVMFNFIKLDVTTTVMINFETQEFIVDVKSATYIESHDRREYLLMEYQHQYLSCKLFEPYGEGEYRHYPIMMIDDVVDQTQGLLTTNLIIDKLNIYYYLFKK